MSLIEAGPLVAIGLLLHVQILTFAAAAAAVVVVVVAAVALVVGYDANGLAALVDYINSRVQKIYHLLTL